MIGSGVLKGMLVTLRQFIGTYPLGRAVLRGLGQPVGDGLFTVSYPEVKQNHHERFRYFPFLVYDGTQDNMRCVACRICEQECPPQCMHIIMEKDEKGAPVKKYGRTFPARFDIDVSICMSCRICVDVCPFDAIEMDNNYEISVYDRGAPLRFTRDELLRSNDYFSGIKPEEYAVVEKRLAPKRAKAEAAAKEAKKAAGGTDAAPPPA